MNRLLLLRIKARLRDAFRPISGQRHHDRAAARHPPVPIPTRPPFFGRAAPFIGRRLREDRIGRESAEAAFPEKSPEEIEKILAGVWGHIGAEFHLDHIWDYDPDRPDEHIEFGPRTRECRPAARRHLRDCPSPAIWRLGAAGAGRRCTASTPPSCSASARGRRPRHETHPRSENVTLIPPATFKLGRSRPARRHAGSQWFGDGVDVTFFGRKTKANPTLARLVRQIECPSRCAHYPSARPSLWRRTVPKK